VLPHEAQKMKDNKERDQKICRLYLTGAKNMRQIADQFNLSIPRIHQILNDNGITGSNEIEKRHTLHVPRIKDIIREEPDISTKQIASKLGLDLLEVSYLIRRHKIKRDKSLVMSRSTSERRRNGRMILTRELLHRKYVIEKKPQTEIAEELGYTQVAISRRMRRLGIKSREPGKRRTKKP
jgi:transcriptional regulator with GAF, ATPase, and Fis domain